MAVKINGSTGIDLLGKSISNSSAINMVTNGSVNMNGGSISNGGTIDSDQITEAGIQTALYIEQTTVPDVNKGGVIWKDTDDGTIYISQSDGAGIAWFQL